MKTETSKRITRVAGVAGLAMALGPLAALSLGSQGDASLPPAATAASVGALASHDMTRHVPAEAAAKRLVDVADGAGAPFFRSVLRAASLGDLLEVDGPYTLFIPVDEAFSGMGGEALSRMLHDPERLRSMVKGHIVAGRVSTTDLLSGSPLETLGGEVITPRAGTSLRVNDASVVATEVAGDGIVHYVDRVL